MINDTWAPEYSEESIAKMRNLYAQSQQGAFDRAQAQLLTSLGGRGALYGTPYFAKGGQMAGQLAGNVAGYEAGLRGQGLEAQRGERLIGEQRAYEKPFTEAGLTGTYGGQQTMAGQQLASLLAGQTLEREYMPKQFGLQEAGLTGTYGGQQTMAGQQLADALKTSALQQQYYPSQYTGQLPGGGQTFQYQQWAQMSPYQQVMAGATQEQVKAAQQEAKAKQLEAIMTGFSGLPEVSKLPLAYMIQQFMQNNL